MQVTLKISNADEKLIKALKGVINLYPQAKLKVEKEELTENGYTPEFEAEVLEGIKEVEEQRKNGTLKTYKSVEEAFRAEGII
ncbi:hypothetical protein CQA53_05680 [Helicobacter didelphidarum]|uniref:Uncharacterized protein n=1 Tax=Helicobacter didelphidarum TaxID=2040648 RepID=A0A3D8IKY6_9HELI|nr:hypothetical protein [Helicobacter didelphidarum]RDU65783.1 hypothetical protein CQA53_05680 [Helicobacter didelphidarum]